MVVFPNCKINLGLQIKEKRADGFHDLETVFYPVALQDALEILPSSNNETSCITTGISIHVASKDNICTEAYRLIQKDFPQLPAVHIYLHKAIPSGAGLGGGSSDGAHTLALLNKKWSLGISQQQLLQYALRLGSDCPFFIVNKPCFARGRGEVLEPVSLDLSSYKIILINPGIHINTAWAFSRLSPTPSKPFIKDVILQPMETWKQNLSNDFEEAVFAQYPEIAVIKKELYNKGAIYASLSGSGSTVYGIFSKDDHPPLSFAAHYFIKTI